MAKSEVAEEQVVATNRKARHEYFVLETFEAGIVLKGTEVKSLRRGNASLADGYAEPRNGEIWLAGVHINPYEQGTDSNVEPTRIRKLLLHKKEIRKLIALTGDKGSTIIPLKLYFRNGVAKVLLGLARGKKAYDKRQDIAKREAERSLRQRYAR
jgi:SsrA-binding protein